MIEQINELKTAEKERPAEAKEKPEAPIETKEVLDNFTRKIIEGIKRLAADLVESGRRQIESTVKSLKGSREDIETGEAVIAPIQEKIIELSKQTENEIQEAAAGEKLKGGLKDIYTKKQLAELRAKTKEDYGEGLVEKHHKKDESLQEAEMAQEKAFQALQQKIEAGVVKPDSLHSDLLNYLKIREKLEVPVKDTKEIMALVTEELDFFKKDHEIAINQEEVELIEQEAEKFSRIYQEAYSEASPQQIYELTQDNVRKLAYQTSLDKNVFSGSDHGTRHILEGNMKWADKLITSLGDKVAAKDKVLIHQIIIDHDLGYTLGAAQAKESWAASKDHPLFSACFIEENKEYYTKMFGIDGYEMIQEGVLQHSYVKSEYNTAPDTEKGFNKDIIRSITSTVDALGVTAETKCPAFFRETQVFEVLQKVKLVMDINKGKLPPEYLQKYKSELHKLADTITDIPARRKAYHEAIDNQFNPKTVEMTLGQYTGLLEDLKITEREGKFIPHVRINISKSQALLGDLFGDPLAIQSFEKAMKDFGVPKEVFKEMARVVRQIRETKDEETKKQLMAKLTFESDKAIFEFAPEFKEINTEIEKMAERFKEVITISDEINDLIRRLGPAEARSRQNTESVITRFLYDIDEELSDEKELNEIRDITMKFLENINVPARFDEIFEELKSYVTKKEKEFTGI